MKLIALALCFFSTLSFAESTSCEQTDSPLARSLTSELMDVEIMYTQNDKSVRVLVKGKKAPIRITDPGFRLLRDECNRQLYQIIDSLKGRDSLETPSCFGFNNDLNVPGGPKNSFLGVIELKVEENQRTFQRTYAAACWERFRKQNAAISEEHAHYRLSDEFIRNRCGNI